MFHCISSLIIKFIHISLPLKLRITNSELSSGLARDEWRSVSVEIEFKKNIFAAVSATRNGTERNGTERNGTERNGTFY